MAAKTVYEPYNAAPMQAGYDQMAALTKQSLDISNALTNASIYPTPTGKAPSAASNSYATKNSALGRYNTAVQALTAVSTGIEIGQILSSSRAQARALEARARTNMQQMDFNYAASRLQSQYWGEKNLSKVAHILEEGKITIGEASAGMGGSGFDVSAGDQRVLRYSSTETAKDIDAENRTNYLRSFELWRSTMLENVRLQGEARLLQSQAKAVKRAGKIGAISRGISGALGMLSSSYNILGKNISVWGKQS